MAQIDGRLYFAPGVLMKDLDFTDYESVLSAFERRVHGLFLSPIAALAERHDIEAGALFGAALLVAALIESVARIDTGSSDNGTLIAQWLEANVADFRTKVAIGGGRDTTRRLESVANVFESRFRNGLAHNGYVASLGRLSREIEGPVLVDGAVVTVNPFELARVVKGWFETFALELRAGRRDLPAFAYRIEKLFRDEVRQARASAHSWVAWAGWRDCCWYGISLLEFVRVSSLVM